MAEVESYVREHLATLLSLLFPKKSQRKSQLLAKQVKSSPNSTDCFYNL